MAEQEDVIEVVEAEESEAVATVTEESSDEVSWEQAMEWKKKAERLDKAEKALVEKKRAEKLAKKEEVVEPKEKGSFITKEELAFERFIDKNPELEDYREDLEKYVAKGNTFAEAKILLENSPVVKNRNKISKSGVSFSEGAPTQTSYTKAELEALPQKEYASVMRKIEDGKAFRR
jgi:hypothetical protein